MEKEISLHWSERWKKKSQHFFPTTYLMCVENLKTLTLIGVKKRQTMTLTSGTHMYSCTHQVNYFYQLFVHRLQ